MREFIEHVVNQETYASYFGNNKKLANKFKQISSTRALEEAMKLQQKRATRSGTTGVQFVPSRGILIEMSGQIASACWADMYDLVAEDFPNLSAVLIKSNPGTPEQQIVGAAMLIETQDTATHEKVLLLRGLNPQESYINRKVDVGDFYDAITDYVKQQAEVIGAKPAIVIDDHAGGASTNRPVLFGYMSAKQRELEPVPVDLYLHPSTATTSPAIVMR